VSTFSLWFLMAFQDVRQPLRDIRPFKPFVTLPVHVFVQLPKYAHVSSANRLLKLLAWPAGETLEIAVQVSVQLHDEAAFEREYQQLRQHYMDTR